MTKEEIQKNSEHWYEKYKEVKHELEQERKLNAEIKLLGERCNQLLKDKGDLTDENRLLIQENEEMKKGLGCETCQIHLEYMKLNDKINKLEKENAKLKEKYNRVDVIGYDALKNLTEAKERIRALLFHLTDDTFYVTFETRGQSIEKARQFLLGGIEK